MIKSIVEKLLKNNRIYRDDDPALYCEVVRELKTRYTSLYEALTKVSYQSVRATRQNLQMLNEDLRWKRYKERQRHWWIKRQEYRKTFRDKLKTLNFKDN